MSKQQIKSWAKALDRQIAHPTVSRHELMCNRSAEWECCAVGETLRDIVGIDPNLHARRISGRSETLESKGAIFHSLIRTCAYIEAKNCLKRIQEFATENKKAIKHL